MPDGSVRAIETSVQRLLARRSRLVLAVSGGPDSAVLLDAVARMRGPQHRITVASVDHGTGAAATEATARAVANAARFGLPAMSERLTLSRPGEAAWREARWAFLRRVAALEDANVVTGHTRDDQVETVVMRLLRGAGARGLAGLYAPSAVERPLLSHSRQEVLDYARHRGVEFIEDPTNTSLAYLRNRVRLHLLPAIRATFLDFEPDILRIAQEAADLRARVDALSEEFVLEPHPGALLAIDASGLAELPDDSLRLLLPALVARAGITIDRRGLVRLGDVIRSGAGTRGQLSGGFEAVRGRDDLTIVRLLSANNHSTKLRASGETTFGRFRFIAEPGGNLKGASEGTIADPWRFYIPKSAELVVRQWHPGDRLRID
jgi:tRNA(Ile)-lysidine synthase